MGNNFDFNWKSFKEATIILVVAYLLMLAFGSCGTSKSIKELSKDSLTATHIEKTNVWYNVSRVDTFTRDRLITIMLNANGDTLKEKAVVYVREKTESAIQSESNTEKVDSVKNKSTYIYEVVKEKELSALQKIQLTVFWYIVFGLIIMVLVVLIRLRK